MEASGDVLRGQNAGDAAYETMMSREFMGDYLGCQFVDSIRHVLKN
jgi:hypothetical protein